MSALQPLFYDDLDGTLAEAWRLIARGVVDRRSPFHHPAAATNGLDGRPQVRTVILRECTVAARALRFHTDSRSEKARELAADPRIGLHFYDPSAKIQLRLGGRATLHTDDGLADAAWAGSRVFSRQCYGVMPGPGTVMETASTFALPEPTDEATAAGRTNFAAVAIFVEELEWLYLAAAGHRRARFTWSNDGVQAGWLTP